MRDKLNKDKKEIEELNQVKNKFEKAEKLNEIVKDEK